MKLTMARSFFGVIFLAALMGTPAAALAHSQSCSLRGAAGKYGYTTSGTIPTLGAVAGVGNITLDPSGNLSGAQTVSFNGAIVPETLSGTYTVNADCTGTATVNVYHGTTLARTTNLSVVFDNDERELRAIFLTAGTVLTVQGRKTFLKDDED
jgi:hypothetical protein